ncbi:MAG TPA: FMN-binding protein [Nitrospinota bacterium]|jgi:electron transport complex protein RnfG|nr:FMN-binding protein [Nitrospinota bacterium]MDP7581113.1 FMN-binding protein [Nitrospinota bacterium]HJN02651.1 FMN-binding protein [Nitrospinota bacterium]
MNSSVLKMLVVLTTIGLVSGGSLAGVYKKSFPLIEKHRLEALKKAIFDVLPEAKSYKELEKDGLKAYQGLDDKNNPVGIAFEAEGNGFQAKIVMMVGIDNQFKKLKGMKVLYQIETPGLGNKIEFDDFRNQFKGLSVKPQIGYVKNKKPDKPNEIQAITAATISSVAVVKILNKEIKKMSGTYKLQG